MSWVNAGISATPQNLQWSYSAAGGLVMGYFRHPDAPCLLITADGGEAVAAGSFVET
ncbi:MAG: hypothetical protein R2941_15430 [Desulfobacterales bacterium]